MIFPPALTGSLFSPFNRAAKPEDDQLFCKLGTNVMKLACSPRGEQAARRAACLDRPRATPQLNVIGPGALVLRPLPRFAIEKIKGKEATI